MITAVDSNVVLDVLSADPAFGPASREALRSCRADGGLVACEVVWAELGGAFSKVERFAEVMDRLGIHFTPLQQEAAGRGARSRGASSCKPAVTAGRGISSLLPLAASRTAERSPSCVPIGVASSSPSSVSSRCPVPI